MANGKPGRPTTYTAEIADAICQRLADSDISLRQICSEPEMPGRSTVLGWLDEHEDFRAKYTRAREWQADTIFDDMGELEQDTIDKKVAPDITRVVLQSKQWRAAKLAPKKYSERHQLDHGVSETLEDLLRSGQRPHDQSGG